ncbi:TPA: lipase [Neisseria oralis]
MSNITRQQQADLAVDAYNIRTVTKEGEEGIRISGNRYKILAIHNNRSTGYHGTVYQDVRSNEIIVAHRGTEPVLDDWLDAYVDWKMVSNSVNYQAADSEKLTRMALEKAEEFHRKNPNLPKPSITHVGHSLGGAHVEIQAYRFGHEGVTFNGYGAVGMRGVRQGDGDVTNYAKAADVVSAANAHYGKVILLAEQDDIAPMKKIGYNNKSNTAAPYAFGVAAISMDTHLSSHFVGKDSILSDCNYDRARRLADENKFMIQDYRGDVETSKNVIAAAKFATSNPIEKIEILRNRLEKYDREQERIKEIINSVPPPKSLFDSRMLHMMQNDGTRPDAGKEAYADAGKPDISKPLAKNASAEEFREYGFAALLSDDDDKMHAALDSLLDSDVGRGLRQNADKVYAAQEREQEMARLAEEQARQVDAPVMRMGRG